MIVNTFDAAMVHVVPVIDVLDNVIVAVFITFKALHVNFPFLIVVEPAIVHFDVDLISKIANGICYSNYGFIYNVYTNGLLKGENKNPISSNASSSNYYNVFYNRYDENGTVISDEYGISTNDIKLVSTSFNNYEHEKYNSAIEYLNGVGLCASYIEDDKLLLESE